MLKEKFRVNLKIAMKTSLKLPQSFVVVTRPVVATALSAGFAILPNISKGIERPVPVNEKENQKLNSEEHATQKSEALPWLGVSGDPLPEVLQSHLGITKGLLIHFVSPESPAEEIGLKSHDVLTKINDRAIGSQLTMKEAILDTQVGDRVNLEYMRAGEKKQVEVTLSARPAHIAESKPLAERQWIEPRDGAQNRNHDRGNSLFPRGRGSLSGMLGQIDAKHQQMIEDLLNDKQRGFDLHQQLDQQFEQMRQQMGHSGIQLNFNNLMGDVQSSQTSVMTMSDEQGSVTMQRNDEGTQVTVKDHKGVVLFEGPYHTKEDKAAVDPEIRKRIESQNFSIGSDIQGLGGLFGR